MNRALQAGRDGQAAARLGRQAASGEKAGRPGPGGHQDDVADPGRAVGKMGRFPAKPDHPGRDEASLAPGKRGFGQGDGPSGPARQEPSGRGHGHAPPVQPDGVKKSQHPRRHLESRSAAAGHQHPNRSPVSRPGQDVLAGQKQILDGFDRIEGRARLPRPEGDRKIRHDPAADAEAGRVIGNHPPVLENDVPGHRVDGRHRAPDKGPSGPVQPGGNGEAQLGQGVAAGQKARPHAGIGQVRPRGDAQDVDAGRLEIGQPGQDRQMDMAAAGQDEAFWAHGLFYAKGAATGRWAGKIVWGVRRKGAGKVCGGQGARPLARPWARPGQWLVGLGSGQGRLGTGPALSECGTGSKTRAARQESPGRSLS
ncbi:Capsule polysaccharide export protein [Desulfovibrio sp. DV]|nr:Capsule polysaccharide export protein [Desulfovibrio sp. DV]